jgi:hypothetical protein
MRAHSCCRAAVHRHAGSPRAASHDEKLGHGSGSLNASMEASVEAQNALRARLPLAMPLPPLSADCWRRRRRPTRSPPSSCVWRVGVLAVSPPPPPPEDPPPPPEDPPSRCFLPRTATAAEASAEAGRCHTCAGTHTRVGRWLAGAMARLGEGTTHADSQRTRGYNYTHWLGAVVAYCMVCASAPISDGARSIDAEA